LTSVDRKQLSMNVTSIVPATTISKNVGNPKIGVTFTEKSDMDIDSFKESVDGVDEWFVNESQEPGLRRRSGSGLIT